MDRGGHGAPSRKVEGPLTSSSAAKWRGQANVKLVIVPPESDSLVTQLDVWGWEGGPSLLFWRPNQILRSNLLQSESDRREWYLRFAPQARPPTSQWGLTARSDAANPERNPLLSDSDRRRFPFRIGFGHVGQPTAAHLTCRPPSQQHFCYPWVCPGGSKAVDQLWEAHVQFDTLNTVDQFPYPLLNI